MSGSLERVLVVGTTWDYVALIEERIPGRALFLTDRAERERAFDGLSPESEILCDLTAYKPSIRAVESHVKRCGFRLKGITCFDCESLELAALLGDVLGLSYPSLSAVRACRSKWLSKKAWRNVGVRCPRAGKVQTEDEALAFFNRVGGAVVIKPLCGSGSELTFCCSDEEELTERMALLREELCLRQENRMYDVKFGADPRKVFLLEERVEGQEYSCDCALDGTDFQILRLTRKVSAPDLGFGTTLAYLMSPDMPPGVEGGSLCEEFCLAARALGLERALFMVDFMVRDGEVYFLELTPRPGGDCLPFLVEASCGLDTIAAAIEFAEGEPLHQPRPKTWKKWAGVRLLGTEEGRIVRIDDRSIEEDHRTRDCTLKVAPGHEIVLPPRDYDSRVLGHVIMEPGCWNDGENECLDVAGKLSLELEPLE